MSLNNVRNEGPPLYYTHRKQLTVYKTFKFICTTNDQYIFLFCLFQPKLLL